MYIYIYIYTSFVFHCGPHYTSIGVNMRGHSHATPYRSLTFRGPASNGITVLAWCSSGKTSKHHLKQT